MTVGETWIEGLPDEPGDYWFYTVRPGYPSLSRVKQGSSRMSANGVLMHLIDDFVRKSDTRRIWHMPLELPAPPDFDRTCTDCNGTGRKSWRDCPSCRGKGSI